VGRGSINATDLYVQSGAQKYLIAVQDRKYRNSNTPVRLHEQSSGALSPNFTTQFRLRVQRCNS
jgi:hypothetical protein